MVKFVKKLDAKGQPEKRKYILTISEPVIGDRIISCTFNKADGAKFTDSTLNQDGSVNEELIKKIQEDNKEGTYQFNHEQGPISFNLVEKVKELELVYSPGSNKYDNLLYFVEQCSYAIGKEFDDFYIGLIKKYEESGYDHKIIKDAVPNIIKYCDQFIEIRNINFDAYINKSKASKSSIFFDASEIKEIIKAASYLKLYYSIHKDISMKLSDQFNREIFQELVKNLTDSAIILKLHKIVSSKTYEYNHTDKYMWEYIKNLCCKTPDMHISHIFNFIINNIIVTCEIDANPIPYLISVIDESIKWVLRSIYKESIIYSDAISTQDVVVVSGKDNLESYAHNNTIGMLTILAYQKLEDIFQDDTKIEDFKVHIESIKESSVFAQHFTFPIMSKITDIPYRHFLTLNVSTTYLLNMLLYALVKDDEFGKAYPTLTKILTFYNMQKPISKTTYRTKNIADFTKTFDNFMGFKNYTCPFEIYSSIVGKINKNEYTSFLTGNIVPNFPAVKMENELIEFYNKFFSGQLDDIISNLRDKIDAQL